MHIGPPRFIYKFLFRLRQPDFLVLLLPGIHIVVQRFRDNILQEDAFHEGNVLHLTDQIRIHDEGGSDFLGLLGTSRSFAFLGATHILPAFGFQFGLHLFGSSRFGCFLLWSHFRRCCLRTFILIILYFWLFCLFCGLFNLLLLRQFFCLVGWIGFTHEAVHP